MISCLWYDGSLLLFVGQQEGWHSGRVCYLFPTHPLFPKALAISGLENAEYLGIRKGKQRNSRHFLQDLGQNPQIKHIHHIAISAWKCINNSLWMGKINTIIRFIFIQTWFCDQESQIRYWHHVSYEKLSFSKLWASLKLCVRFREVRLNIVHIF